jgi:hypothetical protein
MKSVLLVDQGTEAIDHVTTKKKEKTRRLARNFHNQKVTQVVKGIH